MLNDGGEVDLDLGNYERYLDVTLSRDNNITTGKIYREVIEKEVCLKVWLCCPWDLEWIHAASRRLPGKDGSGGSICPGLYMVKV